MEDFGAFLIACVLLFLAGCCAGPRYMIQLESTQITTDGKGSVTDRYTYTSRERPPGWPAGMMGTNVTK